MKKKKKKKRALAKRGDADASQMFVRVPLPPELVELVRKHVDRAGGLLEMGRGVLELVTGGGDAAKRFVGECVSAGEDAMRDVERARKALGGRRRRRARRK